MYDLQEAMIQANLVSQRGRFGGFGRGKQNVNSANTANVNANANTNANSGSTANTDNQTADASSLALLSANVQSASDSTGQVGTPEAGQANSNT